MAICRSARTFLQSLAVTVSDEKFEDIQKDPLYKLVEQKRALRSAEWMKHIGYTRETTVAQRRPDESRTNAAKNPEKD